MNITKYTTTKDICIVDQLFLKGEEVYISESEHLMNGRFDYARKVFNKDKTYLGRIRSSYFDSRIKNKLTKNE